MNKDGHSIFEKYKNTSAKQQIVEEGMIDVLKSRNNQVITEIEKLPSLPSKPTTIKDKYQNVILTRVIGTTADGGRTFITSRPDEYPSQVGLPKGATVDSEVHNLNSEDDEAGDPYHPDYYNRKQVLYKNKEKNRVKTNINDFDNYPSSEASARAREIRKKFGVGGSDIPRMPPRT